MNLEILKKSLLKAPVVEKGVYSYMIHPLTDGVPEIQPALLDEVVSEMHEHIKHYRSINKIVTMEAMGIPLATALSLRMNIPFTIIRKRSYGLPGEVSVKQVTGYSKSKLYINGCEKKDIVVLVDDVLSTGGTLRAVLKALKQIGVVVKGVFIVVDKGNIAEKICEEFDLPIDTLANIEIIEGKVIIKQKKSFSKNNHM